jgi:5-amino-6-(5-phosphoribosylamino)uracil reductase
VTVLRLLLPGNAQLGDLDQAAEDALQALADLYAYPAPLPERGWVRATMVTTVDGAAAGPDGLSRTVSSRGDRAVFSALRGLADVILVGAGTARAERYKLLLPKPEFAERRAADRQLPAPALAVVTRTGEVGDVVLDSRDRPDGGPFFVITCADADVEGLRRRFSDAVLVAGGSDVDPDLALAQLSARGFRRVLLEGGPNLLGRFLAADRIDDLCLTISPLAVAGHAPRIAVSPADQPAWAQLRIAHLMECDGSLVARWVVRRR